MLTLECVARCLLAPRLQREMKIAVIENEYGSVSIDTALVEENIREVSGVNGVGRADCYPKAVGHTLLIFHRSFDPGRSLPEAVWYPRSLPPCVFFLSTIKQSNPSQRLLSRDVRKQLCTYPI